jgi:hypothetical protein
VSEKLRNASDLIGFHLDAIRREVFKAEYRERMKLTFIARDPINPESDIFLSEDKIPDVIDLLSRTVTRATR